MPGRGRSSPGSRFCSSPATSALTVQGALDDSAPLLKKSFGPREMLQAVQESLGTPSA